MNSQRTLLSAIAVLQSQLLLLSFFPAPLLCLADEPHPIRRCEIVPGANDEVSLQIDGVEKVRWNSGDQYPRPFFYPFRSPSGGLLTRMGHPGASNHDHHRSVWFAHANVDGVDFWSDNSAARIRQKLWQVYDDGDSEAVMASLLGWYDGDGRERLEQQLVAALQPLPDGEHALELQVALRPPRPGTAVELAQTNFGLLGVRVARSVSAHFGGGLISDSEGRRGEAEIFGQPARWVDYSGPVAHGQGPERQVGIEGITYFDHPANHVYPNRWHVREDGWMGASVSRTDARTLTTDQPLVLRYLLHAHRGPYDARRAERLFREFCQRPGFVVAKSTAPHRQFAVQRSPTADAHSRQVE